MQQEFITVTFNRTKIAIRCADSLYVIMSDDHCTIYMFDGSVYRCRMTLKALEKKAPCLWGLLKMHFDISYRVVAWVIISLKEGWGRITEAISSSVSFWAMATANSLIISVALAQRSCAPMITWVSSR